MGTENDEGTATASATVAAAAGETPTAASPQALKKKSASPAKNDTIKTNEASSPAPGNTNNVGGDSPLPAPSSTTAAAAASTASTTAEAGSTTTTPMTSPDGEQKRRSRGKRGGAKKNNKKKALEAALAAAGIASPTLAPVTAAASSAAETAAAPRGGGLPPRPTSSGNDGNNNGRSILSVKAPAFVMPSFVASKSSSPGTLEGSVSSLSLSPSSPSPKLSASSPVFVPMGYSPATVGMRNASGNNGGEMPTLSLVENASSSSSSSSSSSASSQKRKKKKKKGAVDMPLTAASGDPSNIARSQIEYYFSDVSSATPFFVLLFRYCCCFVVSDVRSATVAM
jgi:hypothetical protein